MTLDSLKEACDKINVTFNCNLLFYHNEVVGRYYHNDNDELVCAVLSIGLPYTIEGLNDENEIVNWIVKAIKYFKKRENEIKLERINNDF